MPVLDSHLRPTRWTWLTVAPFWLFRALECLARRHFGLAEALAFVWDVPLALGLLSLARFGQRDSRTALATGSRRGLHVVLCLLVAWDLLLRAGDVVYAMATGGFFNSTAFLYLRLRNWALLKDGDLPKLCALLALATAVFALSLWLDGRALRASLPAPPQRERRPLRARLTLALALLGTPLLVGWNADTAPLRFAPEALMLREWLYYTGLLRELDEREGALTPQERERFVALGLLPRNPAHPDYPLLRTRVESLPFPHPRKPGSESVRPNVALILVEQLNRDFIHALSGELEGVMPELSALAGRTTVVTDYRSITMPTIQAVVASLCSIHLAAPTKLLHARNGGEALERTPLSCLPAILRAQGYRTVYIQSGDSMFAGTRGFLQAHGFDEIYDRNEVRALQPDAHNTHWGYHDDLLLRFTQQKWQALEAEQKRTGQPFFMLVQTIDTHFPGHAPAECESPPALVLMHPNDKSQRMLRALYCTDKALGTFTRFLLEEPRAGHTLWALSGDHPVWAGAQFATELYEKRGVPYPGFSAALPLFLYDRLHTLPARVPVLAGHLDIAPTLLHILGLTELPNAMTGRSIFGARARQPLLVGSMPPDRAAVYRPEHTETLSTRDLARRCERQEPLIADDPGALTACELKDWLAYEAQLWSKKRIFPADLVR